MGISRERSHRRGCNNYKSIHPEEICLGVPLRFLRRRFFASSCKHLMLAVATMFVFLTDDSQADDLTIEIVSLPSLRIEGQLASAHTHRHVPAAAIKMNSFGSRLANTVHPGADGSARIGEKTRWSTVSPNPR